MQEIEDNRETTTHRDVDCPICREPLEVVAMFSDIFECRADEEAHMDAETPEQTGSEDDHGSRYGTPGTPGPPPGDSDGSVGGSWNQVHTSAPVWEAGAEITPVPLPNTTAESCKHDCRSWSLDYHVWQDISSKALPSMYGCRLQSATKAPGQ